MTGEDTNFIRERLKDVELSSKFRAKIEEFGAEVIGGRFDKTDQLRAEIHDVLDLMLDNKALMVQRIIRTLK